ncbi:MAG: nucleotidyl transferase AbiEii/AbiGii toxin family protein [Tenericutes bacterium]|nr:nucleotidyl transferase AbiEii/AbiGii toxin family protein [Mycoplasmatota bacterium]
MQVLDQMLKKYSLESIEDKKNAIKEIIQEIVLSGLARSNFFKDVAFYGGTALRIFYDLDRFSEDLDFTLLVSNPDYEIYEYISFVKNEVESLGLKFQIEEKTKTKSTDIKSAFLKGNTKEQFLVFYPDENQDLSILHADEKIKVKFDIDTNPPSFASTEVKYRLLPYPYQVRVYDLPSLFAGKIDAVLSRSWMNRVKGRDFYDYIYFLSMDIQVNIKHLKSRLVQSKFIEESYELTRESLIEMLNQRFDQINFEDAKKDVAPFISDLNKLTLWSSDFFKEITKNVKLS